MTDQSTGLGQVHSGSLTALVAGPPGALQVTVKDQLDPRLRAALTGLVQAQALDAQLAEAGPETIGRAGRPSARPSSPSPSSARPTRNTRNASASRSPPPCCCTSP